MKLNIQSVIFHQIILIFYKYNVYLFQNFFLFIFKKNLNFIINFGLICYKSLNFKSTSNMPNPD